MPSKIIKRYSNGEITVIWQPDLCCHSTICYTDLPEVFDPSSRPWIKPMNASTEKIIKVVKACPTDALTFEYDKKAEENKTEEIKINKVQLIKNGPIRIEGPVILREEDGTEETYDNPITICRCGKSWNKPFCDGSHNG